MRKNEFDQLIFGSMQTLTDDVEIFQLLELAGADRFDATKPAVLEFTHHEQFALLLFIPLGTQKGCLLFLLDKENLAAEAESLLLPALLQLPEENVLKNEALATVERIISEKKRDNLFFDAH